MWCIPKVTYEFIERMEEVLDVYQRPYDPANPVVCIDEKPVPLLADIREPIAIEPGSVKKIDYEYERNGSVNVFVGVEPKAGQYFTEVTERRCSADFANFLCTIAAAYSEAKKITLVMDNLSTHSKKALVDSLGESLGTRVWDRFEVVNQTNRSHGKRAEKTELLEPSHQVSWHSRDAVCVHSN